MLFFCVVGRGESITVFSDDFEANAVGSTPANWTTTDLWKTRLYGGNKIVLAENSGAASGRMLARTFSPVSDSWIVTFNYDWQWGGNLSSGSGTYNCVIQADVVDASNNGYRVCVHQGTGSADPSPNDNKLIEVFKVTAGVATLVVGGQGRGYNQAGWSTRGLTAPDLKKVKFVRDAFTKQLSIYRDVGAGDEQIVTVSDESYVSFSKLVMTAKGFGNNERPAIDNISITRPGRFVWGVAGHPTYSSSPAYWSVVPLSGSSGTSPVGQVELVKELGCSYYRMDATDEVRIDQLLTMADAQGVTLLPVISIAASTINDSATYPNPGNLYDFYRTKGLSFATKYKGRFPHMELGNETDSICIKGSNYSGANVADYDAVKYQRVMNALKGLSDGVRAGDASVKRIINTAGWYHYGFVDLLIADQVNFEVLGWHWYSQMGSMGRIMRKLSAYEKPIWVTEVNRWRGSYSAQTVLSDDFMTGTDGIPPSGWSATGDWKVRQYSGIKGVLNEDVSATPDRVLTRSFTPIAGDWELDLAYDWRWGGNATYGYGTYGLIIDCDVVDGLMNGYRVRIRQGNGNNSANDSSILGLYKITNGVATLISGANGAGYNQNGFANGAPRLKRIRLQRDRQAGSRISVACDPDGDGVLTTVATGIDTSYNDFTKVVITTRGYSANEQPMIGNIALRSSYNDEAAQAESLSDLVSEIRNFAFVEAIFAYELLDEPTFGTFNGEAYYGLCSISKNAAGARVFGHRKLAFTTYQAEIATHGTIPIQYLNDGDVIVDDAYGYSATKYAASASIWAEGSTFPGFFFDGYKHDNSTNKDSANYVRLYGHIPATGNYVVSIRYPCDAANAAVVPVGVHSAAGLSTVSINQQIDPNGWHILGRYSFNAWQPGLPLGEDTWENASDAAYVQVNNTGTSGRVIVDAIRFHRVP